MDTLIPDFPLWLPASVLIIWAIFYALSRLRRTDSRQRIFDLFRLNPATYRLLGTDMADWLPTTWLRGFGLGGVPDAAFMERGTRNGIVGEFKSRKYKSKVKWYERYQITLYMGLMKQQYKLDNVEGRLAFADTCLAVPFDEALFHRLLALRNEYREGKKRGRPFDSRPLYRR